MSATAIPSPQIQKVISTCSSIVLRDLQPDEVDKAKLAASDILINQMKREPTNFDQLECLRIVLIHVHLIDQTPFIPKSIRQFAAMHLDLKNSRSRLTAAELAYVENKIVGLITQRITDEDQSLLYDAVEHLSHFEVERFRFKSCKLEDLFGPPLLMDTHYFSDLREGVFPMIYLPRYQNIAPVDAYRNALSFYSQTAQIISDLANEKMKPSENEDRRHCKTPYEVEMLDNDDADMQKFVSIMHRHPIITDARMREIIHLSGYIKDRPAETQLLTCVMDNLIQSILEDQIQIK